MQEVEVLQVSLSADTSMAADLCCSKWIVLDKLMLEEPSLEISAFLKEVPSPAMSVLPEDVPSPLPLVSRTSPQEEEVTVQAVP